MYQKETRDKKYQNNPYRAVNFRIDKDGDLLCPNDKKFLFLRSVPVKGNRYGRTEELFQCEDCSGCPHKEKCTKAKGNRTIRLNQELTHFHQEVLDNLNCIHGALLRMNRSIQAEGAFGGIKWNRSYTRARRRGLDGLLLETALISCGFNLHKFYLKSSSRQLVAYATRCDRAGRIFAESQHPSYEKGAGSLTMPTSAIVNICQISNNLPQLMA